MADAHVWMDYEHNAIHQGRFYSWSDKQTISSSNVIGWSLHWYEEGEA